MAFLGLFYTIWLRAMIWLFSVSLAAIIAKCSILFFYNLFLHPARKFPGPWLAAATPLPFAWHLVRGTIVDWVAALHQRYGETVRFHPDELSFTSSVAWQDIYCSRPQLPKPVLGQLDPLNGARSLVTIPEGKDHAPRRRMLSHAFSDRALREQEPILKTYTDLLVKRLREQVDKETKSAEVDLCDWYNFTTFDIIGDLCFAESFDGLQNGKTHEWVASIFVGVKVAQILTVFHYFSPLKAVVQWLTPQSIKDKASQSHAFAVDRIDKRVAKKTDRPDFMKFILESNHANVMTREEVDSTVALLVFAGSETSAMTSTAATFFALQTPGVMKRLGAEIRDAFSSLDDITVSAVTRLPYLHAVITEALRMHPTEPMVIPRLVDRPGVVVAGREVPVGVRVGIPAKALYRMPSKFVDPNTFIPERWLADADHQYADEDKAAFEPFMVGPRNCIGKSLAWAEMKLILAKVIWTFDLELADKGERDWSDQRVWLTNEKRPMFVTLRPRKM